ncbi:Rv1355c family protein [Solirubrobacter soli]|uniref:Rv1355c family protein n=1 Tax=Solirubrobacter soli TaxID=363832 RepID=UPI00069EF8EB|nr:Rv1355c family protein [Solirubrobacter soli]
MRRDVTTYRPRFVAPGEVRDAIVVDELEAQLEQLARGRVAGEEPAPDAVEALLGSSDPAAFGAWVFYPWRHTVVHVLPETLHRELRLDRNRYAITEDEQAQLGALTIAVAGLSVGRAVVTTLAHEGIGGELRLADFDVLDLSNLNRVSGGLADVGVNKVVLAAREVAELDPYIHVIAFPDGVDEDNIDAFVGGADVVVDECDGLEIKVALRERARAAGIPVVMATSHRGILDVERFDREPDRPAFHGLLGDATSAELRGLTTKQKVPYVVRILDPASLTDRAAASLVEVKQSVSTWPQLASDVALGGAMVASAVRRIALGATTVSGRFYADLDAALADGREVELPALPPADATVAERSLPRWPRDEHELLRFVAACATSAPSGGNIQPWRFEASGRVLRAYADPSRSSLLDFDGRASLLALGAALEAAVIGARALGLDPVVAPPNGCVWELTLEGDVGQCDSAAVELLWQRSCNRRTDASPPLAPGTLARLAAAGAPLLADVFDAEALPRLGGALGALDRVRFLSTRLREDMLGELRFAGEDKRDGIDVASLELDATDRAAIDVLRTGSGMAFLADHDRGWGLVESARDAFSAAGGALVLRPTSTDPDALVDAGRGLMRLWLQATRDGLAIHPWGSPFLFQRLCERPDSLEPWEHAALTRAAAGFVLDAAHPILLVLRVSQAGPPTVRSQRRPLEEVLTFTNSRS